MNRRFFPYPSRAKLKRLRVFEHQTLRVGEEVEGVRFEWEHFNRLATYAAQHEQRYYQLRHRAVRFSHYVGAIQIGSLVIEVLPKVGQEADTSQWQGVLIRMLRICKLLRIENPGTAYLQLHQNSILDLYFSLFMEELIDLMRKGLFKTYWMEEANLRVWKGQLRFEKQIQHNYSHMERCYARYAAYNYNHMANRILREALLVLARLPLMPRLQEKLQALMRQFPAVERLEVKSQHFEQLKFDRKAAAYYKALDMARLLIFNFSPDVQMGRQPLLALMFDMNVLFEEYLYRKFQELENAELRVYRQQHKAFWNRRHIRPDMLLVYRNKRYILDTKWKQLKKQKPSMADLKQVFIYNQYFQAQHAVLLYPATGELDDLPPSPFQLTSPDSPTHYCQIKMVNVLHNGQLNPDIAKEILAILT